MFNFPQIDMDWYFTADTFKVLAESIVNIANLESRGAYIEDFMWSL